jgi:hypothetical protein
LLATKCQTEQIYSNGVACFADEPYLGLIFTRFKRLENINLSPFWLLAASAHSSMQHDRRWTSRVLVNLHITLDYLRRRWVTCSCVDLRCDSQPVDLTKRDLQREDVANIMLTVTIPRTSHSLSITSLKLRSSMFNRKTPFQHRPH